MDEASTSSAESGCSSENEGDERPPPRSTPSPTSSAHLVRIDILDDTAALPSATLTWLKSHAERALEHLKARGEVRVRIVDDTAMSNAHKQFSGVEGTTDVLTFDLSEDDALDVDIVACFDQAQREAETRNHTTEQELLLYIVHGVLHCLGQDDHDPDDARAMHAREDETLRAIGVGDTYAAEARARSDTR